MPKVKNRACNTYTYGTPMELVRYEAEIRRYVSEGVSHASISRRLCHLVSSHRGFSERSVRRFCAERDIHYRSRLSDRELDVRVRSAVHSVGHSYGRRTLHGLMRSQHLHVSQGRLGSALSRVAPGPSQARRTRAYRQTNPIPYRADYYGEKIKMRRSLCMV